MALATARSFRTRAALRLLVWTGLFVGAGYLGRATIIDGGALSLVWPAAGVAMLWFATARRPALWLDLFAFTSATFVVNVTTGAPLRLGVVFVLANLVQVVVFLSLARRWLPDVWGFGGRRPLSRSADLGAVVLAALLACLVAAVLGTVGLRVTVAGGTPLSFVAWWGRNTVGLVAVGLVGLLAGPILSDASRRYGARGVVAALGHALRPRSPGRAAEVVLLGAATLGIYWVVFEVADGAALAFLVLAPTFWAGIRFSPLAATLHSLVCAATTITFTIQGSGPFLAFDELTARALVAQLCVLMTMVAGLSLAFSHALERHVAAELTALMDASRMAAMITADADGQIRTFGVGAERMLGYRSAELVDQHTPATFLDSRELRAAAKAAGVTPGQVLQELARREEEPRTWTFVRKDGTRLFARLALSELRGAGGLVTGYLGVAIDVSEAIRDRDRAEGLFASAPQGIAVLTSGGVLERVNPALCLLVGRTEEDLVGTRLTAYSVAPDDQTISEHLELVRSGGQNVETTWRLLDGRGDARTVSLSSTLLGEDGEATTVLTNIIDVSERENLQQQLAHLANHDALTGLPNRRWFLQELEQHLARCREHGPRGALLMVDLDQFKAVNDTLGHAAGDAFLVGVAGRLREGIRRRDSLARLGGDEFAILLPDADVATSERVAAAAVRAVGDFAQAQEGAGARVTASVGGVLIDHGDAADLLHAADEVLYAVKAAGRNQHLVLGLRRQVARQAP